MRIHFARYQEVSKPYARLFMATLVIGGLAALSSADHELWIAEFLLAASFVLLWIYVGLKIRDDYRHVEYRENEISGDEYIALDSRLRTYPDVVSEVDKLAPNSARINYAQAYQIEEVINREAAGARALRAEQAQRDGRDALRSSLSKD